MFRGRVRHVHFVGVGGIGMSGLAEILRTLEFEVSGSDMKQGETTQDYNNWEATSAGAVSGTVFCQSGRLNRLEKPPPEP